MALISCNCWFRLGCELESPEEVLASSSSLEGSVSSKPWAAGAGGGEAMARRAARGVAFPEVAVAVAAAGVVAL